MPTFRSDSSANTTITVTLTETGRGNNTVTWRCNWSAKLGSATGLGTGYARTLTVYNSGGTTLGSSQIKASTASWSANNTYSGNFSFSCNVGTNNAGTLNTYIRVTGGTGVNSCLWTNASYCTVWGTGYSLYYTGVTAPNGVYVSPLVFEDTATITWNAPTAGTNNAIASQTLVLRPRASSAANPYATINVGTAARSYTYNTSGIARGNGLYAQITVTGARGGTSNSPFSTNATNKNRIPNVPTSPTVPKTTYLPGETIRVSFTNTGDADGNGAGFEVARDDSETIRGTNASKSAAYVDVNTSGWAQGAQYRFRVRQYDAFGVRSGWSTYTPYVTLNTAPLAPQIVYPRAGVFNTRPRVLLRAAATNDGPQHIYELNDSGWKSTATDGALFSSGTATALASARGIVYRPASGSPWSVGEVSLSARMFDGYLYSGEVHHELSIVNAPAFSEPLVAGETPIRAVHITELYGPVNALRDAYGLGAYGFSGVTAGVTALNDRTVLTELQDALDELIIFINNWDTGSSTHNISVDWVTVRASGGGTDAKKLKEAIEQIRSVILSI